MEGSPHLSFKDNSGYLDGDLIRLLAIYRYGGMWFDMDSLFVRDMAPLMEHEWLSQWDCFLPNGFPFNVLSCVFIANHLIFVKCYPNQRLALYLERILLIGEGTCIIEYIVDYYIMGLDLGLYYLGVSLIDGLFTY